MDRSKQFDTLTVSLKEQNHEQLPSMHNLIFFLLLKTLVLDQGRFLELRDKTTHLTLVTSVLLVTYNTVGEPIAGVQSLKMKLKEQICTLLEGVNKR